ncbi:MAG: sugar phosphate nucleotidyltransferase [Ferrimicrobium sp.]
MQAVIIAGGEGTRLRPLTTTAPKPMLPVVNRPILSHVLELLVRHGCTDVIITVAYLGNSIRTYFGDGSDMGLQIRYIQEETPLGTAGAVANARDLLTDSFLVLSGDVITDFDLSEAFSFHQTHGGLATILLTRVPAPTEFGIVMTDDDGAVQHLIEKPSWGEVFTDTVNTGMYVLEPKVLDRIPTGRPVDFSHEVFPELLSQGESFYGHVETGYWADVGTFAGYLQTHRDILDGVVDLSLPGFRLGDRVFVGRHCQIDPTAIIEGPAIIGDDVRIGPHAHILPHSVIGNNVRIGGESVVAGGILYDHCYLGERTHVRSAIVGRGVDLRNGVVINGGAVLGDDAYVGHDALVMPEVKVYPGKRVEPMTTVTTSIVWESGASRTVFGPLGVEGLANIDITPELATRISMAYASLLPPHATVIAARDTSRAARVMKRAMMLGFNAVGLDVIDLEATTLPVLRHHVATTDVYAGFRIALDPNDSQSLVIRLLGADGSDLGHGDRRKIERALEREDFRRVAASEIGDLRTSHRSLESWTQEVLSHLPVQALRTSNQKILVDYSFGLAAATLPTILATLNLESLAINPYAATRSAINIDRVRQRQVLTTLLSASDADLGVIIDPAGESISVVDDTGHLLTDDELAATFVKLLCETGRVAHLVTPVNMPLNLGTCALSHGVQFSWCGLTPADLASAIQESKIAPAIGIGHPGLVIVEGCAASPDAALSLGLLLGMLAERRISLSKVRESLVLPRVAHDSVVLPHSLMGQTMREVLDFAESSVHDLITTVDGVRVDSGNTFWLVAPDASEPRCHIWSGATDDAEAININDQVKEHILRIRLNESSPNG